MISERVREAKEFRAKGAETAQKIRAEADKEKTVILAEATSSLDGENEKKVLLNIMKKFESQTVFFVTHKLDNMEMFTKILLMDKGKLIETGNHENLMKENGKYAALIKKNYT